MKSRYYPARSPVLPRRSSAPRGGVPPRHRGKVHLWYHKAHVLNEPVEMTRARLVLAGLAGLLRNGLAVLGITRRSD